MTGQKGQFNIPPSGVERRDIDQRELRRVQDVGQVEPKLLAIRHLRTKRTA